jgi:hypothetical protein
LGPWNHGFWDTFDIERGERQKLKRRKNKKMKENTKFNITFFLKRILINIQAMATWEGQWVQHFGEG